MTVNFLRRAVPYLKQSTSIIGIGVHRGLKIVFKYPVVTCSLLSLPLVNYSIKKRRQKRLVSSIDAVLETGSMPPLLKSDFLINRPQVMKSLKNLITSNQPKFGIVLGPSGTGKTYLTRDVCNQDPCGVLYHEIYDPLSAAEELAQACRLQLAPSDLFDSGLSYIGNNYVQYHVLPDNQSAAISYVLNKVAERAVYFRERHGYCPCFFIDGVDLLAKTNHEAFVHLVDRAKYFCNSNMMRIILVSSEGSVLPLLEKTSSASRNTSIVEVLDVADEDAEKFLKTELPPDLARSVFDLVGGRLLHLMQARILYEELIEINNPNETSELFGAIKERLVTKNVTSRLVRSMSKEYNLKISIMKIVLAQGSINPFLMKDLMKEVAVERIDEAIQQLIAVNLLRYEANGKVTCHSKLVSNNIKDWLM